MVRYLEECQHDYAPAWVKTNPQRFKRVLSATGIELWILSSHCKANLEADKKAFTALCKYLKAKDSTEQTVIGIQVENEPGIIGSDRRLWSEAQSEFDSPVPAKLVTAMKAAGDSMSTISGTGRWHKIRLLVRIVRLGSR